MTIPTLLNWPWKNDRKYYKTPAFATTYRRALYVFHVFNVCFMNVPCCPQLPLRTHVTIEVNLLLEQGAPLEDAMVKQWVLGWWKTNLSAKNGRWFSHRKYRNVIGKHSGIIIANVVEVFKLNITIFETTRQAKRSHSSPNGLFVEWLEVPTPKLFGSYSRAARMEPRTGSSISQYVWIRGVWMRVEWQRTGPCDCPSRFSLQ